MHVQTFWVMVQTEWRLQWRSFSLWAILLAVLVYSLYELALVPREVLSPGEPEITATSLLPVILALFWSAQARRSVTHGTAELIGTSTAPYSLRIAAEMGGSLLVGVTLLLTLVADDLALVALGADPGLLLRNPVAPVLLAVPPLFAWLTISRLAATWLPPAGATVAMLLLWAAGGVASGSWRLSAQPGPSPLTSRLLLLLLGLLVGLLACVPRQKGESTDRRGLMAWVLITSVAFLLFLPGLIIALG